MTQAIPHQPAVELALNPPQLAAVRNLLRGNIGPLSPFNLELPSSAAAIHPQQLAATGLCDPAGNIHPYYGPLLDVLARPAGMVRVLFTTELGAGHETFTYFGANGGRASLSNQRGLACLGLPDAAPATLELVGQHFGDSVLKSCEFEIELHPDVAMVLGATLDMQRRAFFQGLAGGTEAAPVGMDASHLTTILGAIPSSTQWLTRVLAELLDRPRGIQPANIPSAIYWLVQARLLEPRGPVVVLAPPALALSRRLLVIDRFLSVTATRFTPQHGLEVMDVTCLQAGVHDLLMLDSGGDRVHLKTTSSASVLSLLTHLLAGGFLRAGATAA
jgi:hypothetical protein